MVIFKLAYRNIKGAGIRTWLNVFVLSMAFVILIYLQGLYNGIGDMSVRIAVDTHYGGGQIWSPEYDPYDQLTLQDMNTPLPPALLALVESGDATPMLMYPGAIYPKDLRQGVVLRGLPREQQIVNLPTSRLSEQKDGTLPVVIGSRWAGDLNIQKGETFTLQWRDANGSYDALDAEVIHIMETENNLLDSRNLWIDLSLLQDMIGVENAATYLILRQDFPETQIPLTDWNYQSVYDLSADVRAFVVAKSSGSVFFYGFLIALAGLAIFDTQVLNLWRRKKEMGTMMAMGMTRGRLIKLFTLEGSLHGIMAAIAALIWGGPLLYWQMTAGFKLPYDEDMIGFLMPRVIFPAYTLGLILFTTVLTLTIVTIVSYLPVRKISDLKPTDALRGKMS